MGLPAEQKSKLQTMQLLQSLYKMPRPRAEKCNSLYDLARKAQKPGVIVELGTFHGTGAIALYFGSAAGDCLSVFTIDAYSERKGWAGESYGPKDRRIAQRNYHKAGICPNISYFRPFFSPIQQNVQDAVITWVSQISLLFWDLGCQSSIEDDLTAWWPHLRPGATIALHDTMDGRLGAESALLNRGLDFVVLPGGIWTAEVPFE